MITTVSPFLCISYNFSGLRGPVQSPFVSLPIRRQCLLSSLLLTVNFLSLLSFFFLISPFMTPSFVPWEVMSDEQWCKGSCLSNVSRRGNSPTPYTFEIKNLNFFVLRPMQVPFYGGSLRTLTDHCPRHSPR